VKLRTPAFLVLGMLRLGATSGYAIKKAADVSTRFFWPTSLAQVYPQLAELERAGLVTRRDDAHGARARDAYEVTEAGEDALLEWLRSGRAAPTQFRDEGVLRLFFADALPPDDRLALVRRMRDEARAAETRMRTDIVPMADALARGGTRFPAVVAHMGADAYAYAGGWLERLAAELEG